MQTRITKRTVDAAQPLAKPYFLWDEDLAGFGLKVNPTSKVYVVQSRVDGRTVRATIGHHGVFTPEEARLEARKKLGLMAGGVDLNKEAELDKLRTITLGAAYRSYVAERSLTANTLKDYAKAMRIGFPDWEEKPVTGISRLMVERRFDDLSASSPAQANQMFRFLRALLNYAKEKFASPDGEPLIPSNPCDRLTALKKWHRIERRTRHIEPHQLRPWFAALSPTPDDTEHRRAIKDCCALILMTGCREQEAARLQWGDVDMNARKVTFRITKNHQAHTLPIGSWLEAMLERRRKTAGASSFVFPAENATGHLLNHRKGVMEICARSGVEFRLHDLRRTFASIVNHHLGRSLSAYTIKRLLNHSGGADVTAGYIQFGVEDLRESMEQVEAFVLKCAGIIETTPVVPMRTQSQLRRKG
ncbi:MAG: site-specific integrase [Magnetococcales bacterium]|nr:site-specific integrase [Magnetococcales bacterium]